MLDAIKEMYGKNCLIDEVPQYPNDYFWFKTDNLQLIAIHKSVSLAEKTLLSLMFDEVAATDFDQHTRILWWELLLEGKKEALKLLPDYEQVELIFFSHRLEAGDKTEFESLIREFDPNFLPLFLDRDHGVILDLGAETYESEDLEAFVEAARQDFYYGMTFYKTAPFVLEGDIKGGFRQQWDLFKNYQSSHYLVMSQNDLLLESLALNVRESRIFEGLRATLKLLSPDTVQVVITYLEHNFNLSMAAKEQHMHRNTVMNKLDKFISITGLNVKEFRQATLAYYLLKSLDHHQD